MINPKYKDPILEYVRQNIINTYKMDFDDVDPLFIIAKTREGIHSQLMLQADLASNESERQAFIRSAEIAISMEKL